MKPIRAYTRKELDLVRKLAMRGLSTAQVAKRVRRSPGALRYKCHTEGISFRALRA